MPVPTMLATTMQVAVRSEIVLGLRTEGPDFTGDHLAAAAIRFNREVDPPQAMDALPVYGPAYAPASSVTVPSQFDRRLSLRFRNLGSLILSKGTS